MEGTGCSGNRLFWVSAVWHSHQPQGLLRAEHAARTQTDTGQDSALPSLLTALPSQSHLHLHAFGLQLPQSSLYLI